MRQQRLTHTWTWLGLVLALLLAGIAHAAEDPVPPPPGFLVLEVTAGSPAERAGLRVADLMLACDGTPLGAPCSLYLPLERGLAAGKTDLPLLIQRQGNKLNLRLPVAMPLGIVFHPLYSTAVTQYMPIARRMFDDERYLIGAVALKAEDVGDLYAAAWLWHDLAQQMPLAAPGRDQVALKLAAVCRRLQDPYGEGEAWELHAQSKLARDELTLALDAAKRSVELIAPLAPGTINLSEKLLLVGQTAKEMGDVEQAMHYYQRALAIQERVLPNSLELAITLKTLADLLHDLGDYQGAMPHLLRAQQLYRIHGEQGQGRDASVLVSIGRIYYAQRKYAQAAEYYEEAIIRCDRLLARDAATREHDTARSAKLSALRNLGLIYQATGELEKARTHIRTVIELSTQWNAQVPPLRRARTFIDVGILAHQLGAWDDAGRLYQSAYALYQQFAPTARDIGFILLQQGDLAAKRDQWQTAQQLLQLAIQHAEQLNDFSVLWQAQWTHGRALRAAGKREEACLAIQAAVTAFEQLRFTDTGARGNWLDDKAGNMYGELVELLLELRRPAEALNYLERARARALRDAVDLRRVQVGTPQLQELLSACAVLTTRLHTQQTALMDATRKEAHRAQIRKAYDSTLVTLSETTAAIAQTYGAGWASLVNPLPATCADLQAQLPDGVVAVQYFPAADRLYIFVLTRTGVVVREAPITREDLHRQVRAVRDAMASWATGKGNPTPPAELRTLHQALMAPVAGDLAGARTVIIVPGGLLHYLPFLALRAPDGRYLVQDDRQYVVMSQLSMLATWRNNTRAPQPPLPAAVLLFGNPPNLQPPLPNLQESVRFIAQQFPGARDYLGEHATETRVHAEAAHAGILHFATHGILNADDPTASYILLAPDNEQDGQLTVGEIFSLPLRGSRLVVLSACETGLGEANPGWEVSSLAKGFALAGAPRVLASLWPVTDASTAQLMETFYEELAAGKPTTVALRNAQRSLLASRRYQHPYCWAGFQVYGLWD